MVLVVSMTPVMYSDISGEFAIPTIIFCSIFVGVVSAAINVGNQYQEFELKGSQGDFLKDHFNLGEMLIEFSYGTALTAITMSTGLTGYSYFAAKMGLSFTRSVAFGIANDSTLGEIVISTSINLAITAAFSFTSIKSDNLDIPIRGYLLETFGDNALMTTDIMVAQVFITGIGNIITAALRIDYSNDRERSE